MIPVLCFIKGSWAYFTTRPLAEQWGGGWDYAPYERNAGEPYGPCWHNKPHARFNPEAKLGWKPGTQTPLDVGELCRCDFCVRDWNEKGEPTFAILKAAWDGPFKTPCDAHGNSSWSVKQINAGAVAWLISDCNVDPPIAIPAGATIEEFIAKVQKGGGDVYVKAKVRPNGHQALSHHSTDNAGQAARNQQRFAGGCQSLPGASAEAG